MINKNICKIVNCNLVKYTKQYKQRNMCKLPIRDAKDHAQGSKFKYFA